ncbi:uncharacterized protein ACA1_002890, partial [Acanthamoeba castellanii str. Neff]
MRLAIRPDLAPRDPLDTLGRKEGARSSVAQHPTAAFRVVATGQHRKTIDEEGPRGRIIRAVLDNPETADLVRQQAAQLALAPLPDQSLVGLRLRWAPEEWPAGLGMPDDGQPRLDDAILDALVARRLTLASTGSRRWTPSASASRARCRTDTNCSTIRHRLQPDELTYS